MTDVESLKEFYDVRGAQALADWSAAGDLDYPVYWRAALDRLQQELQKLACGSSQPRLLDAGCGTGLHLGMALQSGFQVVGVDVSPKSLAAARMAHSRAVTSGQLKLLETTIEDFLAAQAAPEFDVIFMSGAAYYVFPATLRRLLERCLKPGGSFICIETYGGNPAGRAWRFLQKQMAPSYRDQASGNSLLTRAHVTELASWFVDHDLKFFDLATCALHFLVRMRLLNQSARISGLAEAAMRMDRVLLKHGSYIEDLGFRFFFSGRGLKKA